MASQRQTHFFALYEDWIPVFKEIENKSKLKYILCGNFLTSENPKPIEYNQFKDIPNIGVATGSQEVTCEHYLVMNINESVICKHFIDYENKKRYTIDQMSNTKTIVFCYGGLFQDKAIISGSLGTIHSTNEALDLMKIFRKAIYKFNKVNAFYVGPNAYKIFKNGFRLTCCGVDSPQEYDLQEL